MTSVQSFPAAFYRTLGIFALASVLLVAWAVLPQQARAAGVTQEQMDSIEELLQSFDVDSATINAVQAVLTARSAGNPGEKPAVPGLAARPAAALCGMLMRDLRRGSTGDDVTRLQEFLTGEGYLGADNATGYFGPATEQALQKWQAREGIVASGDANTTGYGLLGPKTRQLLMTRCKGALENKGTQAAGTSSAAQKTPTCTLRASKTAIEAGESVTLYWETKNATHTSSVGGGEGPTRGSIVVAPTETTTYLKRAYGPGGEGECTRAVEVINTAPAAEQKVVVVPVTTSIKHAVSLMGSGMAAVLEGYFGLFGVDL